MKILHFYPGHNSMITQYVSMLCEIMDEDANVLQTNNLKDYRKQLNNIHPDIVHLHGCWSDKTAIGAHLAIKKGIRIVLTPHGQLEQWIIRQNYWKEKLPRIILYQQKIVSKAYSIIAMGRMEENSLKILGWNRRIETVRNPLVTDTITKQDAHCQLCRVYRKVLDTDVLKLMNQETRNALEPLIKAGITGNHMWLNDHEYNATKYESINWRQVLLYAYHENIIHIIRKGIVTLNLNVPEIKLSEIPHYVPDRYTEVHSLAESASKRTNEEDSTLRFVHTIKQIRKLFSQRELTISHLVEFSADIRRCNIKDDKVSFYLYENSLTKFASSLMYVLHEMTGLEEGFMPVPAKKDNRSRKIKKIITKHLEL